MRLVWRDASYQKTSSAGTRSERLVEALARYAATHPQLKCRLPSPTTVASLVARAQKLTKRARR